MPSQPLPEITLPSADAIAFSAVLDQNAGLRISQKRGSPGVGAYQVAGHDIPIRTGVGKKHAGVSVSGNNISLRGIVRAVSIRTDAIVRRAGVDPHAEIVTQCRFARSVGADQVSGHDVVIGTGAGDDDAVPEIAGKDIGLGLVAAAVGVGTDGVARGAGADPNTKMAVS